MAFVAPNREAGRILYQGMMDQARGIAGAVNQFVDEGYKRQEQDKEFNAKLKVTEQALSTFIKPKAAEFGTTPEAIDAFLKVNPSESPKERYLRLGGFLEQAITSSKLTRDQQQAETQRKYTDALAASAMAQKSAQDAATAERQRQAKLSDELEKTVLRYGEYEKRTLAGSPNPLSDAEEAEYIQMQDNPIIQSAIAGRRAGISDTAEGVRLGLTMRGQDMTDDTRRAKLAIEEQMAEIASLRQQNEELRTGKGTRFAPYDTRRKVTLEGKEIELMSTGQDWVDAKTGITYEIESEDFLGRKTKRLNPQFLKVYGLEDKFPMQTRPPVGAPGAAGATATPPKRFATASEAQQAIASGQIAADALIAVGDYSVPYYATQQELYQAYNSGTFDPGKTPVVRIGNTLQNVNAARR